MTAFECGMPLPFPGSGIFGFSSPLVYPYAWLQVSMEDPKNGELLQTARLAELQTSTGIWNDGFVPPDVFKDVLGFSVIPLAERPGRSCVVQNQILNGWE